MTRSPVSTWIARTAALGLAGLLLVQGHASRAQWSSPKTSGTTAGEISDFFGSVGDKLFKDCIFELSDEQIQVQQALVKAYIAQGASDQVARQLAVKQIEPPKLSVDCERLRGMQSAGMPGSIVKSVPPKADKPASDAPASVAKAALPPARPASSLVLPPSPSGPISLADKTPLAQWDCAPGVDYVTIQHNGHPRKLTGGEICMPFEDVVHEVPADLRTFRLGYAIRTGRLFVIADGSPVNGRTITWGLSGRDVCRNNPDPDCLASRAVGPLPPGEYKFANDRAYRVTWGPKTKRPVAAVYLSKLWHRERFSAKHTQAILARGNIAIHMRLKGEMSEACIGLEPRSWAYIAGLIKDGRATSLDVHIDEPHPQIAGRPPVIAKSSFSLSSLFK